MGLIKDTCNFESTTSIDTLVYAHNQALKGKRNNRFATGYDNGLFSNLNKLQVQLRSNAYKPYAYRKKVITEPKVRLIEAPAYRDRIIHHALHYYLSPYYERFFIPDSYACRPGRGIHSATAKIQKYLKNNQALYVCQLDISKYYASINHSKLIEIIEKKVHDKQLINLLEIIIESTDSGTEHDHLFDSDSYYFTKGRRGIPIGNLTSQLFANIYLHEADMYAKQTLKIRHYVRYMDDILFFHNDKKQLQIWMQLMTNFLYEKLYLTINPHKVRIYPTKQGVSFVGYVIYPHYMRLRGSSVRRFKNRYLKQLKLMVNGKVQPEELEKSFASWEAHAMHASSDHLIEKMKSTYDDYLFINRIKRFYKKQTEITSDNYVQLSLFDDL